MEPLIRRIRTAMAGAGLEVENSKGECNLGQHEINFRYTDALRCADEHVIYKNGAKEIAAQEGMSISFMAKYDAREGSSCHIHFSLKDSDGAMVFAAAGSFAPTTIAWAHDNRTCALRVVGHGDAQRFENRAGGSDLNPYMALSALIAAGLHGVREHLELEPALVGNAYVATDRPQLPRTLREARDLFDGSAIARAAFGDEVVDHYVHAADVELEAFESAVTDWERVRGFERL